jgi:methylated-DNA-[protein]-cysteine S-methyltransferase
MLARDLRRYFTGEAVDFRGYPVDISSLPPFLRRALEAARGIPYGQVRTYKWVAARAGRGRAARAAGQAMSRNPVALLVPCHRVVGSGGKLTGFGGGLPAKRALLELEGMVCHGDRVLMDSEQRRGRKRQ